MAFIERALAETGTNVTHFPTIDRATFIGNNYAWEAAVWTWAVHQHGGGVILNGYINDYGASREIFKITQYFINGYLPQEQYPHFDSDLRAMRQDPTQ